MKRATGLVAIAAVVTTTVLPALAQQSVQPSDPHQHGQPPPAAGQPAPAQPAPGSQPAPGARRGGMMGGGMGGMMGGGMMGTMRSGGPGGHGGQGDHGGQGPMGLCPTAAMLAHHDTRASARSLKLCGDLLKAVGDVLLKHGAEMDRGQ